MHAALIILGNNPLFIKLGFSLVGNLTYDKGLADWTPALAIARECHTS